MRQLANSAAFGFACLALGACQWIPGTEAHAIEQSQEVARQMLIDPTSAMFRNVEAYSSEDDEGDPITVVCGEINGKNRNGAYAGYSRFIASADVQEAALEPEVIHSDEERGRLERTCRRAAKGPFYSETGRDLAVMQCEQWKDAIDDRMALAEFELGWSIACGEDGNVHLPKLVTTLSEGDRSAAAEE